MAESTTGLMKPPPSTATPSTYHRIITSAFQIPFDPQSSIPVGILACQRDPLLRELETTVVSSRISESPQISGGRKGKKDVASTTPRSPILEVVLHDTVVFPEGGGQPSDTGLIQTDERVWVVAQARRHGGHAVHYVQVEDPEVDILHFATGVKVLVKLGDADWDRRYDHMTMHTSQHLLSAVLEERLNIETLSWSLTDAPAPCYVELARMSMLKSREMERPNGDASGVGNTIPADYTGGVMRVVVIDGVDRNPCCGTHWPTLHNLQLFLVPQTETLARSNTTSARLYFFAGPRLVEHFSHLHKQLAATAAILSCGPPQVRARVEQVVAERKRAEKRVDELESELSRHIGEGIAEEMAGRVFVKHVHRVDDSVNALGFLSAIATAFAGAARAETEYLVVLSSTGSCQSATGTSVLLVVGSAEGHVQEAGRLLRERLGVKGGGKGSRWSGKLTGVWKAGREIADTLGVVHVRM